ncbi:hypothetical protein QA601_11525 [Chitinispirillales bacterium ANBcel5]|uniref:MutS-related protein n=1 Tax=Cellulosispirillum alkaliphilum TaxID=3039283 RepID=UPI002A4F2558|nr:hypothetical protein [Chitinispirillales bacterium ANBcel5]
MESEAFAFYSKRVKDLTHTINALRKRSALISNVRLLLFLVAVAGVLYSGYQGQVVPIPIGISVLALTMFIVLIIKHGEVGEKLKFFQTIRYINERGIKRCEGTWQDLPDTGEDLDTPEHLYCADLDIFGKGSLFQHISSAHTLEGRRFLGSLLTYNDPDPNTITHYQGAVKELSTLTKWRQEFEAKASLEDICKEDPQPLIEWMGSETESQSLVQKRWFFTPFPFITILLSVVLAFFVNPSWIFLWIPVNLITYFAIDQKINKDLSRFEHYENSIAAYSTLLRMIESADFSSSKLHQIKSSLDGEHRIAPSKAVRIFNKRLSLAQIRHNAFVAFFLNLFFLWDLQTLYLLYSWRRKFGTNFSPWIDSIATIEAFISLSNLFFENPQWRFPKLNKDTDEFSAKHLGHPLIHQSKRITNDFNSPGKKTATIVTGSNMSGKTTFLRTIGINLVLAYSGAPVCASECSTPLVKIYSSMRITDDLQGGISTFYSELIKIKRIINHLCDDRALVLIDEIFRGTNSRDRHTAALIVIKQLLKHNSMVIVSTHDYELTSLEKNDPSIYFNYHFRDTYTDNTIHFDYKLYPGPSDQSNALALVRLAGIDVE